MMWDDPPWAHLFESLGSFSRLILFDKRGTGLSDRVPFGGLDERMDDIRAVLDAAGSEQAVVVSESEGAALAALFAATTAGPSERPGLLRAAGSHPERTRVSVGSRPGGVRCVCRTGAAALGRRDHVGAARTFRKPPVRTILLGPVRAHGDEPGRIRRAHEGRLRDRHPAGPRLDHRPRPWSCTVRTTRRSPSGRAGTSPTPSPAPGSSNWQDPTTCRAPATRTPIVAEIREFVTGERGVATIDADRVLTTVVFTDIVRSTERAVTLGDEQWRRLLDRHDTEVTAPRRPVPRPHDQEPRATASWPPLTGRPVRSGAQGRSTRRCGPWPSRCGRASTPARSRFVVTTWPASRSTPPPGAGPRRSRVRCWCRGRSWTSSPDLASPSKSEASTPSRESRAPGSCYAVRE